LVKTVHLCRGGRDDTRFKRTLAGGSETNSTLAGRQRIHHIGIRFLSSNACYRHPYLHRPVTLAFRGSTMTSTDAGFVPPLHQSSNACATHHVNACTLTSVSFGRAPLTEGLCNRKSLFDRRMSSICHCRREVPCSRNRCSRCFLWRALFFGLSVSGSLSFLIMRRAFGFDYFL
jgi:hypothetical protein